MERATSSLIVLGTEEVLFATADVMGLKVLLNGTPTPDDVTRPLGGGGMVGAYLEWEEPVRELGGACDECVAVLR